MLFNFYVVKSNKFAKSSTTTKAREKICTDLDSLEFGKIFDACLTIFKNKRILLNKISQLATNNQAVYWAKEPH
jgi:hypothetical protein